jgi:hypothetical protein
MSNSLLSVLTVLAIDGVISIVADIEIPTSTLSKGRICPRKFAIHLHSLSS